MPSFFTSRAARLGALALLAGLAACTDSVNQRVPIGFGVPEGGPAVPSSEWQLADVRVVVPESLTVSTDPDDRVPGDDIVWWGEPGPAPAERRAQVAAILGEAVTRGLTGLGGRDPVIAHVTVHRFHALTPRARASCGLLGCLGNINIDFVVEIRDAGTGDLVASSGLFEADPEALQGDAAAAADRRGETDKVRIIAYLTEAVRRWAQSLS